MKKSKNAIELQRQLDRIYILANYDNFNKRFRVAADIFFKYQCRIIDFLGCWPFLCFKPYDLEKANLQIPKEVYSK